MIFVVPPRVCNPCVLGHLPSEPLPPQGGFEDQNLTTVTFQVSNEFHVKLVKMVVICSHHGQLCRRNLNVTEYLRLKRVRCLHKNFVL